MDKQSNPCSLYLSLLPENEIKNVYISDSDEEGFRQYLTEQVQKFDDSSCAIPDIWLVQINFENRRKVERATSKIEGIIRSELEQQKVRRSRQLLRRGGAVHGAGPDRHHQPRHQDR